jgi:hypothetical protein
LLIFAAVRTPDVAATKSENEPMYKPYHYCDWSERKPEKSFRKIVAKTRTVSACDQFLMDDCRILIHPLVLCPPIAKWKRYLLVERRWWGQRDVLKIGRARSPHESVNLARLRHTAARLGATEVHVLPT